MARFKMYQLPENCYSISVRLGDQEVNDNLAVDLTRGVPGPLTVRLRGKSPRVEGTVVGKDGKPVASATVVMVPDMPSQRGVFNFYMNERTNQKGQFAIRWLWPGDYKLYAWEDVEDGAWLDEEFLKPFASKAQPIGLKEGDQRQIQVEVIPADR